MIQHLLYLITTTASKPNENLDVDGSQVRLQALGAVIVSRSSKEIFSPEELDLLLTSLPNFMTLMEPADRQEFVQHVKKVIAIKIDCCSVPGSDLNQVLRSSFNLPKMIYAHLAGDIGSVFLSVGYLHQKS